MGIRNKKQETLRRLDSKTLDARFLNEIRNGLNCSPFEAEAVLELQIKRAGSVLSCQPFGQMYWCVVILGVLFLSELAYWARASIF